MGDDRNLNFGEEFSNIERAAIGQSRPGGTGQVACSKLLVHAQIEQFLAVFSPHVNSDSSIGPWRLKPIFTAIQRQIRVRNRLVDMAALETGGLEVVQRVGRHPTSLENVPRDAARIDAIEDRTAH